MIFGRLERKIQAIEDDDNARELARIAKVIIEEGKKGWQYYEDYRKIDTFLGYNKHLSYIGEVYIEKKESGQEYHLEAPGYSGPGNCISHLDLIESLFDYVRNKKMEGN